MAGGNQMDKIFEFVSASTSRQNHMATEHSSYMHRFIIDLHECYDTGNPLIGADRVIFWHSEWSA